MFNALRAVDSVGKFYLMLCSLRAKAIMILYRFFFITCQWRCNISQLSEVVCHCFLHGLLFIVFLLMDWVLPKVRFTNLPCYLNHSRKRKETDSCSPKGESERNSLVRNLITARILSSLRQYLLHYAHIHLGLIYFHVMHTDLKSAILPFPKRIKFILYCEYR